VVGAGLDGFEDSGVTFGEAWWEWALGEMWVRRRKRKRRRRRRRTYFGTFLTAFVVCGVFVERVWWDVLFDVFAEEVFSGFVEEVRHESSGSADGGGVEERGEDMERKDSDVLHAAIDRGSWLY